MYTVVKAEFGWLSTTFIEKMYSWVDYLQKKIQLIMTADMLLWQENKKQRERLKRKEEANSYKYIKNLDLLFF